MIDGLSDYMRGWSEEDKAKVYVKAEQCAAWSEDRTINLGEGKKMLLSSYIESLQRILGKEGDLEVAKSIVFESDGQGYYDFDVSADVDYVDDNWLDYDTDEVVVSKKVVVVSSVIK